MAPSLSHFLSLLAFLLAATSSSSAQVCGSAAKLRELVEKPELRPLVDYVVNYRAKDRVELPKDTVGLITCTVCVEALQGLVEDYSAGQCTLEELNDNLKAICSELQILSDEGCDGIIDNYAPILEYVYLEEEVPIATFCAVMLGESACFPVATLDDWQVDIDPDYPPVQTPAMPEDGMPTQKALQITDFHIDLTYTPGSLVDCADSVMCCTNTSGMATDDSQNAAGFWGEYTCDIPTWTLRNMLEHIAEEHPDIDFILLTGDFPAHDMWYQSREYNLGTSEAVVDIVKEVFAGVPVYPSIGNHEAFPGNIFPTTDVPLEYDLSWMYNGMADLYSDWLTDQAQETFRAGGYYTAEISPGFRFIGINSMNGYTINFWMGYHYQDANGQLQWLHDQLLAAEAAGEKVWILSHLPAGDYDCLGTWGREYTRIVERFENIITNQFFGHTHRDEFKVFYDTQSGSRPISVGFVTPSVTPHTNVNMAYRIFTLDGDYEGTTRRVLDYDTYIGDLSQASEDASTPPPYSKLYNAKEDLLLESILPDEYDKLVKRIRDDDEFWEKYFTYFVSGSPVGGTPDEMDRRSIICRSVTTNSDDDSKCEEIMEGSPTATAPSTTQDNSGGGDSGANRPGFMWWW